MSAPPQKSIRELSGKWTLDRKLSTGLEDVMALQGLNWLKIKALSIISVTEACNQFVDENNVTHINLSPTVTGGFKGQDTSYIVDGIARARDAPEVGEVLEASRWSDLADVNDDFLREGWVYGDGEKTGPKNLELDASMNKGACVLKGVWGFVDVDGKRYHARKTSCTKGGKTAKCCAVYSWKDEM